MAEGYEQNPNGDYIQSSNVVINPTYGQRFDLKVCKTGRIINLFGRFDLSTQVPVYTELITIPDGFYSSSKAVSLFIYKFNGSGIMYWLYGDNKFSVQSIPIPNGTYYVNSTWVI